MWVFEYVSCFVMQYLASFLDFAIYCAEDEKVDPLFCVLPIGCGGSVFVFLLMCITLCLF